MSLNCLDVHCHCRILFFYTPWTVHAADFLPCFDTSPSITYLWFCGVLPEVLLALVLKECDVCFSSNKINTRGEHNFVEHIEHDWNFVDTLHFAFGIQYLLISGLQWITAPTQPTLLSTRTKLGPVCDASCKFLKLMHSLPSFATIF